MKTTTGISIYPFILIVFLLLLTTNCKKDKDTTPVKKTPVITWANPADITNGTLLSETQLNATADVPGTLVYTPAIGTKLYESDNQILKVTLTPYDLTNNEVVSKTVTINVVPNIVTDIDGNIYLTVTIGTQIWMVENLKTTKYRDGAAIHKITDDADWPIINLPPNGKYSWYDNNEAANKDIYGALYNWDAVNSGKLCPINWHVPSDAEWTTLTKFLGGYQVAGGKMKDSNLAYWQFPNTEADNSSGFTGRGGGQRSYHTGTFGSLNVSGIWWSSSSYSTKSAWCNFLTYNSDHSNRSLDDKLQGHSVRCIKGLILNK